MVVEATVLVIGDDEERSRPGVAAHPQHPVKVPEKDLPPVHVRDRVIVIVREVVHGRLDNGHRRQIAGCYVLREFRDVHNVGVIGRIPREHPQHRDRGERFVYAPANPLPGQQVEDVHGP